MKTFIALIVTFLSVAYCTKSHADSFKKGEYANLENVPMCIDIDSAIAVAKIHQEKGKEEASREFLRQYQAKKCIMVKEVYNLRIVKEVYAGDPSVIEVFGNRTMYMVSGIPLKDMET